MINRECGMGALFSMIVQTNKIFSSCIIQQKFKCGFEKSTGLAFIQLNQRNLKLNELQNSIQSQYLDIHEVCNRCKRQYLAECKLSKLIAFEVEPYSKRNVTSYKIVDISPKILVGGEYYSLFGMIEYQIHPQHFIAHIKRPRFWQTFDDLAMKPTESKLDKKIIPYMLFYVKDSV